MLPRQGNVLTLRIIVDLQKKIALTEEEIKKYDVKQVKSEGGGVFIQWAPEFDEHRVDVSISDHEKGVISREIMQLESQGKLTMNSLPLYDYFVDNKEPKET